MTEMYVRFVRLPKGITKALNLKKRKRYSFLETEDRLRQLVQELGNTTLSFEIRSGKQVYDFSDLTITTNFQSLDELLLNDIYHSASKLRKAEPTSEEADALEAVAEEIQVQYEKEMDATRAPAPIEPVETRQERTTSDPKKQREDPPNCQQAAQVSGVSVGNTSENHKGESARIDKSAPSFNEQSNPKKSQFEPIEAIEQPLATHVPQGAPPVFIGKQPLEKENKQKPVKQSVGVPIETPLTIVDYMDFSELKEEAAVLSTIGELETSSQSEQETLIDLLGVDKKNLSSLDKKKVAFACELMRKDFLLSLKSSFLSNISELKSLTAQKLEEAFATNRLDHESFEQDIAQLVADRKDQLTEKTEQEKQRLEQQLTAEIMKEKELLDAKQKAEREALKLQHQEIQEKRAAEATHRKEERLTNFLRDERQTIAQQLIQIEQETKRRERTKRQENALVEKQKILSACGKGIRETIKKLDHQKELYFKDLLESVQEMEPTFKKELEAEQQLVLKERELAAVEETNRLTAERLLVEKEQRTQEQDAKGQQTQVTQQLQEFLLLQQQQSLLGTLAPKKDEQAEEIAALKDLVRQLNNKMDASVSEPHPKGAALSKSTWLKGIGLGICGLVLGGLVSYMLFSGGPSNAALQGTTDSSVTMSLVSTTSSTLASESISDSSAEGTADSAEQTPVASEKEVGIPAVPVLEELLLEKKYQEAAKHFPDRLEEIEQRLYVDRELDELTAFNLTYVTRFGQLDEAALRTDVWKVVEQYNQMSSCLIALLSYSQKEDISLSLLKVGRIYEAQQLLV